MKPGDLVADRFTHQPLGRVTRVYQDGDITPALPGLKVEQPYRILVDLPPGPHRDGAITARALKREEDLEVIKPC